MSIVYPLATIHKENFDVDFFNFEIYVTDKKCFTAKFSDIKPNLLTLKTRAECLPSTKTNLT